VNALPLDAASTGDVDWNADGDYDDAHEGRGIAELRDRLDFVGVNYYTRTKVTGFPLGLRLGWGPLKFRGVPLEELPFIGQFFRPPNPTDMGWEVYPDGMHDALVWASQRYGRPIYVTENGIAEGASPDVRRPKYILDHVEQIQRAIADGADVRGYLHWSLMDNFEWAYGFRPKFGLLTVDRTDPTRPFRRTQGAEAFSEVIQSRGVTTQLHAKWAARAAQSA
jgi:beta-galactosidase